MMASSFPRVFVLTLSLLATGAPGSTLAESTPQCERPALYVAKDVIGVEGSFDALRAKLYADTDGGRVEVPIEIEPSDDLACHSNVDHGFRVLAKEPLRAGDRYVLEAQPAWTRCSAHASLSLLTFTAVDGVTLPTELPRPAPELLVQRCPPRDNYYYEVNAPSIATAPDVRLRLSVDGKLHYCVEHGIRGEFCSPGGQQVRQLRWVAEVPHTGVRAEGPLVDVVFSCDSARVVPCPAPPLLPDAGVRAPDASTQVARALPTNDGATGCGLAPQAEASRALPWLILFLLAWRPFRARRRTAATRCG